MNTDLFERIEFELDKRGMYRYVYNYGNYLKSLFIGFYIDVIQGFMNRLYPERDQ